MLRVPRVFFQIISKCTPEIRYSQKKTYMFVVAWGSCKDICPKRVLIQSLNHAVSLPWGKLRKLGNKSLIMFKLLRKNNVEGKKIFVKFWNSSDANRMSKMWIDILNKKNKFPIEDQREKWALFPSSKPLLIKKKFLFIVIQRSWLHTRFIRVLFFPLLENNVIHWVIF